MKKVVLLIASVAFIVGCKKELPIKKSVDFDASGEVQQVNTQTLIEDPTNASNYISSVDSITKYGFGYKFVIPDSLKGINLKVVYSGAFKETESLTGELVMSINEKNMNPLFWGSFPTSKVVKELGKWTDFKDSVIIKADKNLKSSMFLFLFNQKLVGKGTLSVDNLKLKIYKD